MRKTFRRGLTATFASAAVLALVVPSAIADTGPMRDDNDPMNASVQSNYSNTAHLFRVAGPDRVDTAIKLMNASSKSWGETFILARSDDFPDALAGGPLADVYNAPILLTAPGDTVDPRVVAAAQAKGFTKVIILGGTGVITEVAEVKLQPLFETTRMRGVDRYETAKNIALEVVKKVTNNGVNKRTVNVYLATGMNFPDGLAAGAAAADNDGVVLLTEDYKMNMEFTYKFLKRQYDTLTQYLNGIEIHTVGGQAEGAARSSIEDIRDTNTGKDRYETAAMLFGKYKHTPEKVAIVSGEGFADAVSAGGWVSNHDGALLLTDNASLNSYTQAALGSYYAGHADIVVVGGTASVSMNVSNQLAALMTW